MSALKEWMNPLLPAAQCVLIADGEINRLSAELAGAKKSRNAAMQLYESSREHRDHLLIKQREWQEALATLDSERAANALLTAQLAAAEARAERLLRGEFICQKCGLRKDSEPQTKVDF